MKAMIFAAGLGSRLKPLTNSTPKALVPVKGIPMLERTINYLKSQGVSDVIINVHHFADQIEDFLKNKNNFNICISVSDERTQLLDTGGGLKKAAWFFAKSENFVVMNADVITDLNLNKVFEQHQKFNALATLVVRSRPSTRSFLFDQDNILSGWKNDKTGEQIITREGQQLSAFPFSGIHIINSRIFEMIKETGKFSIVDTYLQLSKSHVISGFIDNSPVWFDIGDLEKLKTAEESL